MASLEEIALRLNEEKLILQKENEQLKIKIRKILHYIKNIDEYEFINTEHYVAILDELENN